MNRFLLLLLPLLLLFGCSSTPEIYRTAIPGAPELSQVLADTDAYNQRRVRWGGAILGVRNLEQFSLVEILQKPLGRDGRPRDTSNSQGRFFMKIPGFVDPKVYEIGREVTVIGTLEGSRQEKVGEFEYNFPVVLTGESQHLLWVPRRDYDRVYYLHDPFYDPWYRGWGYPYHYPRYRDRDVREIKTK